MSGCLYWAGLPVPEDAMPEEIRPRWKYEPDEHPKKKHGWHKDEAGFVDQDGRARGKMSEGHEPR